MRSPRAGRERSERADIPSLAEASFTSPEARIAHENRILGEQVRQLQQTVRRLRRLAYVDTLTGLANRRFFEIALDKEIRRASRTPTSIALALCDVDHFKRYNDTYGHEHGDAILRKVGLALSGYSRRAGDVAARYGGEEFALLLPAIDRVDVLLLADRLRRAVANLGVGGAGNGLGHVSISIGVTSWCSSIDTSAADVLRVADRALYQAKEAGRNCVRYSPVFPRFSVA